MKKLFASIVVTFALFAGPVQAEVFQVTAGDEVDLSWTANEEEDLAGYRIYTRQALIDEPTLLGTSTIAEYTIHVVDLFIGLNYISVTALDTSRNESPHSDPHDDQLDRDAALERRCICAPKP